MAVLSTVVAAALAIFDPDPDTFDILLLFAVIVLGVAAFLAFTRNAIVEGFTAVGCGLIALALMFLA